MLIRYNLTLIRSPLRGLQQRPGVDVCSLDQVVEGRRIVGVLWVQFYMTHTLSGAFQQAGRIPQLGAIEKADVHVASKGMDVTECDVRYARDRTAIMHQFPDVAPARPHPRKPWSRKGTKLIRLSA